MRARIMAIASMTIAILMLAALTASAAPKPPKPWNLFQDKLGAYVCTTGNPKGQTKIAGPFDNQAQCQAAMTTPPTIEYELRPAAPDGAADWYVSDVSLDWTVTFLPDLLLAPAPVLDGCVDQSITADQPKTTYTCTATTVFGVSAGPVSVDVKRDATKPSITWFGGIQDGDSFEVGSVPDEPTIVAEDAMSGVASSGLTGYGTAIGAYTLVATATDFAGNMATEQRGYTVFAHPAQVVAPEKTDETCGGPGVQVPGGITIPTVTGVEYSIDGVVTAGGFVERADGVYQVTATALPDYELVGYPEGGWPLEVLDAGACLVSVATEAPIAAPETCDGSTVVPGSITIPAVVGVEYLLGGAPASGVQTLGAGSYTVTAEPMFGYALTGDTSWPLTIDAATCSTPEPLEFIGAVNGVQAGTSVALPEGWQPGDLAVLVVMRNATATYPTLPSGWTAWAQRTAGSTTSQVTSRLAYRVLEAGDTGPSWGTVTFRAASVMVYRNATPGAVATAGGTTTTLTVPGLTLQQSNGSSWVGALLTNFYGLKSATVPGMVNRTATAGGTTAPGGFDTDGGVSSFASRTITASQPWNAYSFELKLVP